MRRKCPRVRTKNKLTKINAGSPPVHYAHTYLKTILAKINDRQRLAIGICILFFLCVGIFYARNRALNKLAQTKVPTENTITDAQTDDQEHIYSASTEVPEEDDEEKPELTVHTVQSGETLWDIAKKYGTTALTIASLNGLSNPNRLSIGQDLTIMTNTIGAVHRVVSGDTLSSIAKIYGVKVEDIQEANDLTDIHDLKIGTQLMIPGAQISPQRAEVQVAARGSNGSFIWPIRGRITSGFGARWGQTHEGIDIAGNTGTPVAASHGGTVTFAGWMGTYGRLIIINCGGGISNYYGHLSKISVSSGDKVSQGQIIGNVGSTGRSTGPHLHFEVRVNNKPKNPIDYLP